MTQSIQLPLNVSACCTDAAVIKAALRVGMIVIVDVSYGWEILGIDSAHTRVDEAYRAAEHEYVVATNDMFKVAIFPSEDGACISLVGGMNGIEAFRSAANA